MLAVFSSLWMGILTSISPCPLATNIAAVSFLGQRVDSPRHVLCSGLAYTLGRTFFYTLLGLVLSYSLDAIPGVSMFLQQHANYVLGPLLVVIGLILLRIIKLPRRSSKLSEHQKERLKAWGWLGAFLLGIIFAAALCPVSAALFFGNLMQNEGSILALFLFGVGTGLPVLVFACVIAFSVNQLGRIFHAVSVFEKWARIITGVVFIGAGIYYGRVYL